MDNQFRNNKNSNISGLNQKLTFNPINTNLFDIK